MATWASKSKAQAERQRTSPIARGVAFLRQTITENNLTILVNGDYGRGTEGWWATSDDWEHAKLVAKMSGGQATIEEEAWTSIIGDLISKDKFLETVRDGR